MTAAAAPALGAEVLALVHRISRLLALYEPNNSAVTTAVDELETALGSWFATHAVPLRLQLLHDEAFVNGQLLKVDATTWERSHDLAAFLSGYGIGELRFEPGVPRSDLDTFVLSVAQSLRTGSTNLDATEWGGLRAGRTKGRSMASFRFQPDRLAVSLYASLLEATESLFSAERRGQKASLLSLRRLLQMAIDTFDVSAGPWQLLTVAYDHRNDLSPPRFRVAVAVDLVGLGSWLQLKPADTLTLALAGLLGGDTDDPDPAAASIAQFRFAGLGTSAVPLVLAVMDARRARLGRTAGILGRLVATVEAYHELTVHQQLPAPQALQALQAGKVPHAAPPLAALLAAWKGAWPLGTPVQLSDGRTAVVVSHGDDAAGKELPTVALLQDGHLTDRIDLRQEVELGITSALSARSLGLDYTAW